MAKNGLEYLQSAEKRRLDIAGGIVVATALLPIGATTGLVSAVDSRKFNPLYTQERVGGLGRETFTALKFQTLSKNMGAYAAGKTFGTFDPRASRVGQFLRQSGLDEIPQIVNVLKGNMSLVGSRPLAPVDIERYEAVDGELFNQWYPFFSTLKPGLTCESQIYRHHYLSTTDEMVRESMAMDLNYYRTASLKQDLHWIATTPFNLARANIDVVENLEVPPAETIIHVAGEFQASAA